MLSPTSRIVAGIGGFVALTASLVCAPSADAAPTCAGRKPTIVGTSGDDILFGTPDDDVAVLGAGFDAFDGMGGADVICGGPGNDTLSGGEGADRLVGGSGQDSLAGDEGHDVVRGGSQRDWVMVTAEADDVFGGPGRDTFEAWSAAPKDTGARIDVRPGTYDVGGPTGRMSGFEIYYGTDGPDVFLGSPADEWFISNGVYYPDTGRQSGGRDLVRMFGGDDEVAVVGRDSRIWMGAGRDFAFLNGRVKARMGPGNDWARLLQHGTTAYGDAGRDLFFLESAASAIGGRGVDQAALHMPTRRGTRIDLATGSGRLPGVKGDHRFVIADIEQVLGTWQRDVIRGSAANELLLGGDGHDVLLGRGGNDRISPGTDEGNRISGGPGRDGCNPWPRPGCEFFWYESQLPRR